MYSAQLKIMVGGVLALSPLKKALLPGASQRRVLPVTQDQKANCFSSERIDSK